MQQILMSKIKNKALIFLKKKNIILFNKGY